MKKKQYNNDVLRLVRVRFLGQARPTSFLTGDLNIEYGQQVIAMSERGLTIGFVNSFPFEVPYLENTPQIDKIVRLASDEDVVTYKHVYQEQREAREVFNQLVDKHQLNMNLADIEFSFHGKKITFYYTAPRRIDFRELLKALSSQLKGQIELRQIRDEVQVQGKIGPCGPDLCMFISSMMESEIPQKKRCDEFNCCLDYKDPFYEDKRAQLPKVGSFITTHTGEMGRVERLDLWNEEFEMLTDHGVLKRYVSDLRKDTLNPKNVTFPKYFETISHDTKIVLGRIEAKAKKEQALESDLQHCLISAKAFAEKNFELLFGEKTLNHSLLEIGERSH